MTSFFRTIFLYSTAAVATVILGLTVIVAALLGVEDKPGGLYDKVPRWWSIAVLRAVGIKLRVQSRELVRRSLARQDIAPEQVRGKIRALQSADLRARNARRGDDRNPAGEPKGCVRRLRCRGRANPRWELGRRVSRRDPPCLRSRPACP